MSEIKGYHKHRANLLEQELNKHKELLREAVENLENILNVLENATINEYPECAGDAAEDAERANNFLEKPEIKSLMEKQ